MFDGGRENWEAVPEHDHKMLSIIAAILALVLLGGAIAHAEVPGAPILPDPTRTPGVTNPAVSQSNINETICVKGWTASIRPPQAYTNHLKRVQLAERGTAYVDPRLYEEDHLVPLSVGGHPTAPGNLWPQARGGLWGAEIKDRIERRLHWEVCDGRLSLAEAQAMIRTDWRIPYCRYIGGAPCPP